MYNQSIVDKDAAAITESVLISAFVSREFLEFQLNLIAQQSAGWERMPALFGAIREWKEGRAAWLSGLAAQVSDIEELECRVEQNAKSLGVGAIRRVA